LWQCEALAPSYLSFVRLAEGKPVDWQHGRFRDGGVDFAELLRAAEKIGGARPTVVTVDMPIASVPITTRRTADRLISSRFGGQGCSTHSPSRERPGRVGEALTAAFLGAGYSLAHEKTPPGVHSALVEVYPHPALLTLLNADYRIPYKVSKSGKLWPGASPEQRTANLLEAFERILDGLTRHIDNIPLALPKPQAVPTLSHLKRYEDALDALICGWVGMRYLEGRARPYGDETAAIWVPTG